MALVDQYGNTLQMEARLSNFISPELQKIQNDLKKTDSNANQSFDHIEKSSKKMTKGTLDDITNINRGINRIIKSYLSVGTAIYASIGYIKSSFGDYVKDIESKGDSATLKEMEMLEQIKNIDTWWKNVKKSSGEAIATILTSILPDTKNYYSVEETHLKTDKELLNDKDLAIKAIWRSQNLLDEARETKGRGEQRLLELQLAGRKNILLTINKEIELRKQQRIAGENMGFSFIPKGEKVKENIEAKKATEEYQKQEEINREQMSLTASRQGSIFIWEINQKKRQQKILDEIRQMNMEDDIDALNKVAEEDKRLENEKLNLKRTNMLNTVSTMRQIADMFKDKSKESFAIAKAAAIAESTMNAFASINATLKTGGFWSMPLAIATGAFAMAQVANIASQSFAKGTRFSAEGMSMLHKDELMNIPTGTQVYSKSETKNINNNHTVNNNQQTPVIIINNQNLSFSGIRKALRSRQIDNKELEALIAGQLV
jgi:hypothetical protein